MIRPSILSIVFLAGVVFPSLCNGAAAAEDSPGPKFYIVTDLEGPAGVDNWSQTRQAGPAQEAAKVLLTGEVNAAVAGILDAEPNAKVDVWDGHGSGGIIKEKMHAKARYLREENPRKALVKGAYDGVFFVGQHAMSGTPQAPLAHTYSSKTIAYFRLNGNFVGEFGARTALAGSRGIPVIFVCGDDKAVLEAKAWVPKIVGVAVKEGEGIEKAKHLSHEEACRQIRSGAAEACRQRAGIAPVRLDPPYRMEIRYYEPMKSSTTQPGRRQIDSRTIEQEAKDLAELPI